MWSLDQQKLNIIKRVERANRRKTRKVYIDPNLPWMTEGVNEKNKEKWLATIYKKNYWLKQIKTPWLLEGIQ
jgi:hypothetical protein